MLRRLSRTSPCWGTTEVAFNPTTVVAKSAASSTGRGQVASLHRVVIVGGGAAGLELATALGRNKRASVTLIDKSRTHVWKSKLYEIAAGSMDAGYHEVGFLARARRHGFAFRMGEMTGLDRNCRQVHVPPIGMSKASLSPQHGHLTMTR